ncbi:hypothetical protein TRVL_07521 [Trypanosoma vivax]|nr:hypothetical protein TRVL_07521 [Trypanosoma vivax]
MSCRQSVAAPSTRGAAFLCKSAKCRSSPSLRIGTKHPRTSLFEENRQGRRKNHTKGTSFRTVFACEETATDAVAFANSGGERRHSRIASRSGGTHCLHIPRLFVSDEVVASAVFIWKSHILPRGHALTEK